MRANWLGITKLSIRANDWESDFLPNHSQIFDQILSWLQNIFFFPGKDLFETDLCRALKIIKNSSSSHT
jgi:hypothetical protein